MGYFSYKICMHNSRPLTFYLFLHYVLHCTLPLNAFFLFASTFYNWKKKLFFWITTCNSNSVAPAKSNQCAAYETNFSIIKANHWFFSPFYVFFYSSSHSLNRGKFLIEHRWWRLIDRKTFSINNFSLLYTQFSSFVACINYFRKKEKCVINESSNCER